MFVHLPVPRSDSMCDGTCEQPATSTIGQRLLLGSRKRECRTAQSELLSILRRMENLADFETDSFRRPNRSVRIQMVIDAVKSRPKLALRARPNRAPFSMHCLLCAESADELIEDTITQTLSCRCIEFVCADSGMTKGT